MFLTQRQKQILQLFLENQTGVTIKQIEESLGISRRTVYREFGDLKKNKLEIVSVAGLRALSQANGAAVPLRSGMPQVLNPCLRVVNRAFVIGCQLASATTSGWNVHIRW